MRGKPTTPVKKIGPSGGRHGTKTVFRADPEMFETLDWSFETISQRLRESAYLNKGLWIRFVDERADRERSFYFEGGLMSFVRHMNRNQETLTQRPIYVERREGTTSVEVALQYNDTYTESVLAFANNINTVDGGTHITGFRAALTSSLNDWARKAGVLKDNDPNLSGDDVREGLTAVVSVKLVEPQFEGQTKAKLGNAEVKGQVQTVVSDGLTQYLEENPGRRATDHREVPDGVARPRGRPQGARSRHPQGRARRSQPAGQAGRLPGARSRAKRALHRRGRLGRRLREAGPRPPLPGHPAAPRQGPERREGTARQDRSPARTSGR